jgi:hypothetical protein
LTIRLGISERGKRLFKTVDASSCCLVITLILLCLELLSLFFYTDLSRLNMTTRLKPFFALALAGAYFTFFSEAFPTDLYSPRPEPRALETTNAKNLREHIEAYGLPYGVLGAVSHGLTFYVMLCHFFRLRPLLPWKRLEKHGCKCPCMNCM